MTEYDQMSLPQLWQLVLGVLLPLAISAVTRQVWRPWLKSLTMLGFVGVTTTIGMIVEGRQQPTTPREWATAFCVVFLATVTTYRHVWRPTGVAGAIEAGVNAGPQPEPVHPRRAESETMVTDVDAAAPDHMED